MSERLVILGNSAAALAAVRAYRSWGGEGAVTLVSKESCDAYSPVLTTYYLRGRIPERQLFVCDASFYTEHRVETRFGVAAEGLSTDDHRVELSDGTSLAYDRLLIATGASARRLDGLDPEVAAGVCYLRTIDDARRIFGLAERAEHVVVVGGGLVSLQVAVALARPGRRVTGLVSSGQLLSQNVDATAARLVERHIEQHAPITFRFGANVAEIAADGDGFRLALDSGDEVSADLVVVGKGVRPNMDFLEGSAVSVGRGIRIDECMRTTVSDVFAAGDVAEGVSRLTGLPEPVPTWTNACDQGRIAGMNLAGKKTAFEGSLPENVTTFFGLPVASIGLTHSDDPTLREHAVLGDGGRSYRKVVMRGDRLVGALLVRDIDDVGVLRSLVAEGGDLGSSAEQVAWRGVTQGDRLKRCVLG